MTGRIANSALVWWLFSAATTTTTTYHQVHADTVVEHAVPVAGDPSWQDSSSTAGAPVPGAQNLTNNIPSPHTPNLEQDPMLERMPNLNFKAYKRADISSMYREPAGSRVEQTPDFVGQAGKFVNMGPKRLDLYWYVQRERENEVNQCHAD